MSHEGSLVKALPLTTRRMMPPTPQQSSHSSNDELQWQTEMEVQGSSWTACERTVIARMEKCLSDSDCVVYLYLSSSSDEHHLLHSCLGTGMRVGT